MSVMSASTKPACTNLQGMCHLNRETQCLIYLSNTKKDSIREISLTKK